MESELKKKLERIEKFLNIGKIVDGEKNSPRAIRAYYRINGFAYRKFHSDRGFMHFRVSPNGKMEENDIFYQPDTVSGYIKPGAKVVELGPGQGANIFYLAKKHPDASFVGIDLRPPKLKKCAPSNVRLIRGNYEDMSEIESGTADVVFGIETVVHSSDKDGVFSEVARVLKPGGVFVLYDYATAKSFGEYLPYQQTAIELISKCGASAMLESDAMWDEHFSKAGLDKISKTDLADKTIPDLHRLALTARRVMDHDGRIRLVFGLMPRTLTNNILIGYIAEDSVKEHIFYYYEWIYEKRAAFCAAGKAQ